MYKVIIGNLPQDTSFFQQPETLCIISTWTSLMDIFFLILNMHQVWTLQTISGFLKYYRQFSNTKHEFKFDSLFDIHRPSVSATGFCNVINHCATPAAITTVIHSITKINRNVNWANVLQSPPKLLLKLNRFYKLIYTQLFTIKFTWFKNYTSFFKKNNFHFFKFC